jgi:hypothetical protein
MGEYKNYWKGRQIVCKTWESYSRVYRIRKKSDGKQHFRTNFCLMHEIIRERCTKTWSLKTKKFQYSIECLAPIQILNEMIIKFIHYLKIFKFLLFSLFFFGRKIYSFITIKWKIILSITWKLQLIVLLIKIIETYTMLYPPKKRAYSP